jgi:hypothetical protein
LATGAGIGAGAGALCASNGAAIRQDAKRAGDSLRIIYSSKAGLPIADHDDQCVTGA